MSVIIRLQNLPWSANALDIRQFFHGLSIPEGGVHIVGGEQGDAFIAFSTDEDARQAFSRTNGKIKEVQISLMLSSRTEMQKVIEAARTKSYAAFMPTAPQQQAPMPAAVPAIIPSAVPDLLNKSSSRERDAKTTDTKRERKRSRSRSRDRKDRDRRRYRDRSRSRSRDRRDRRRRERSRSRGRSRSRDRRVSRKRSPESFSKDAKKPFTSEIWMNNQNSNDATSSFPQVQDPRSIANSNGNNRSFPHQNFGLNLQNNWIQPPENGAAPAPASFLENNRVQVQNQFNQPRRFARNNFQRQDDYPVERDPLPNCCVKLQPFYGGYGDVRRFFQGSFISNVGIKFINDEFGHRTGIVYIQFGHPHGKSEALHRSGDLLNGVKVEVAHIEDEDFEEAIDRYQPENFVPNNDANDPRSHKFRSKNITKYFNKNEELVDFSCLIVEDLPTYVKEQDILKLFSPRPLLSLYLIPKSRGGHIAYVKFGSMEDAKEALDEKSHIVEGKQVTVRPCDDLEFESISQQHDVDIDGRKSSSPDVVEILDTDCINVTLLPLQTNNIEITDFFSDVGVRPTKIHLMSNRLGFTGQAFCEFKSNEDAAKAFKKDNASFGPNHVSIVPIPREEMEQIVNQSPHPQQQPLLPRGPMMNQNRPFFLRNTYDGVPRGGGGGGAGPRFMGHRGPRPRFMNAVAAPSDDAPPGCTVFMDNVPYKAGTNEILDFFDGYDVTNNVCRRFNPNNTPSAEAKVIFNTPDEAFRAVQEKNGQKIWDRSIYLKQV